MALYGTRPKWLTFDCYGTLIQWDEGLINAMQQILERRQRSDVPIPDLMKVYDDHEHQLEQSKPFKRFREIVGASLRTSLGAFGVPTDEEDIKILTSGISAMPPFPEVVPALQILKQQGYSLCIISNTEDTVIAGNVAQLAGTIDRVITAEQAEAYKPSAKLFHHAHHALGVEASDVLHICASPTLDLTAARDLEFRCIWIDRNTGRRSPANYVPNAILPNLHAVPYVLASMGW